MVHNHPSGDPDPTKTDMVLTSKIMDAANTNGLYFEDHVIITPSGGYTSMVDRGLLVPEPGLQVKAKEGAIKARIPRRTQYLMACHG